MVSREAKKVCVVTPYNFCLLRTNKVTKLGFAVKHGLKFGHHTIDRKNTFISILVPTLSFVVFIVCPNYC